MANTETASAGRQHEDEAASEELWYQLHLNNIELFARNGGKFVSLQDLAQAGLMELLSEARHHGNKMLSSQIEAAVSAGLPTQIRGLAWKAFLDLRVRQNKGYYGTLVQRALGELRHQHSLDASDIKQHMAASAVAAATNGSALRSSVEVAMPAAQWTPGASGENSVAEVEEDAIWLASGREWLQQIEKDLKRTFAGHAVMSEGGRLALRRILAAYALHNPGVGYCQGTNYIAAVLMMFLSEEDTFYCLAAVVEEVMTGYYALDMQAAQVDQAVFKQLVSTELPAVSQHLEARGADISCVFAQWFLCAFINFLPLAAVLRVWDLLFWRRSVTVLFQVSLALVDIYAPALLMTQDVLDAFQVVQQMAPLTHDATHLLHVATTRFAHINRALLEHLREGCSKQVQAEQAEAAAIAARFEERQAARAAAALASHPTPTVNHPPATHPAATHPAAAPTTTPTDTGASSSSASAAKTAVSVNSAGDAVPSTGGGDASDAAAASGTWFEPYPGPGPATQPGPPSSLHPSTGSAGSGRHEAPQAAPLGVAHPAAAGVQGVGSGISSSTSTSSGGNKILARLLQNKIFNSLDKARGQGAAGAAAAGPLLPAATGGGGAQGQGQGQGQGSGPLVLLDPGQLGGAAAEVGREVHSPAKAHRAESGGEAEVDWTQAGGGAGPGAGPGGVTGASSGAEGSKGLTAKMQRLGGAMAAGVRGLARGQRPAGPPGGRQAGEEGEGEEEEGGGGEGYQPPELKLFPEHPDLISLGPDPSGGLAEYLPDIDDLLLGAPSAPRPTADQAQQPSPPGPGPRQGLQPGPANLLTNSRLKHIDKVLWQECPAWATSGPTTLEPPPGLSSPTPAMDHPHSATPLAPPPSSPPCPADPFLPPLVPQELPLVADLAPQPPPLPQPPPSDPFPQVPFPLHTQSGGALGGNMDMQAHGHAMGLAACRSSPPPLPEASHCPSSNHGSSDRSDDAGGSASSSMDASPSMSPEATPQHHTHTSSSRVVHGHTFGSHITPVHVPDTFPPLHSASDVPGVGEEGRGKEAREEGGQLMGTPAASQKGKLGGTWAAAEGKLGGTPLLSWAPGPGPGSNAAVLGSALPLTHQGSSGAAFAEVAATAAAGEQEARVRGRTGADGAEGAGGRGGGEGDEEGCGAHQQGLVPWGALRGKSDPRVRERGGEEEEGGVESVSQRLADRMGWADDEEGQEDRQGGEEEGGGGGGGGGGGEVGCGCHEQQDCGAYLRAAAKSSWGPAGGGPGSPGGEDEAGLGLLVADEVASGLHQLDRIQAVACQPAAAPALSVPVDVCGQQGCGREEGGVEGVEAEGGQGEETFLHVSGPSPHTAVPPASASASAPASSLLPYSSGRIQPAGSGAHHVSPAMQHAMQIANRSYCHQQEQQRSIGRQQQQQQRSSGRHHHHQQQHQQQQSGMGQTDCPSATDLPKAMAQGSSSSRPTSPAPLPFTQLSAPPPPPHLPATPAGPPPAVPPSPLVINPLPNGSPVMVNTPLAATPSQRSMGISMLVEEGGPTPSGDLETWVNVSKVAPLAYIPTVGPSPHPHYHRRLQETGSDAGGCLGTGFSPPGHLSTSSNSSGGVLVGLPGPPSAHFHLPASPVPGTSLPLPAQSPDLTLPPHTTTAAAATSFPGSTEGSMATAGAPPPGRHTGGHAAAMRSHSPPHSVPDSRGSEGRTREGGGEGGSGGGGSGGSETHHLSTLQAHPLMLPPLCREGALLSGSSSSSTAAGTPLHLASSLAAVGGALAGLVGFGSGPSGRRAGGEGEGGAGVGSAGQGAQQQQQQPGGVQGVGENHVQEVLVRVEARHLLAKAQELHKQSCQVLQHTPAPATPWAKQQQAGAQGPDLGLSPLDPGRRTPPDPSSLNITSRTLASQSSTSQALMDLHAALTALTNSAASSQVLPSQGVPARHAELETGAGVEGQGLFQGSIKATQLPQPPQTSTSQRQQQQQQQDVRGSNLTPHLSTQQQDAGSAGHEAAWPGAGFGSVMLEASMHASSAETAGSRSGSGSGSGGVPGQRLGLGQVPGHERDPGQGLKQGPRDGVVDDLNINEVTGSIPGTATGGHTSPPAAVQQASAAQHLEAQLRTALGSCQAAAGQLQEAGEWQQQEASLLAAYQELAGELCDRVTSMAQQLAQREAEILTLMDQVHKQAVQLSSKDGELASLTDQNSRLTHTLDVQRKHAAAVASERAAALAAAATAASSSSLLPTSLTEVKTRLQQTLRFTPGSRTSSPSKPRAPAAAATAPGHPAGPPIVLAPPLSNAAPAPSNSTAGGASGAVAFASTPRLGGWVPAGMVGAGGGGFDTPLATGSGLNQHARGAGQARQDGGGPPTPPTAAGSGAQSGGTALRQGGGRQGMGGGGHDVGQLGRGGLTQPQRQQSQQQQQPQWQQSQQQQQQQQPQWQQQQQGVQGQLVGHHHIPVPARSRALGSGGPAGEGPGSGAEGGGASSWGMVGFLEGLEASPGQGGGAVGAHAGGAAGGQWGGATGGAWGGRAGGQGGQGGVAAGGQGGVVRWSSVPREGRSQVSSQGWPKTELVAEGPGGWERGLGPGQGQAQVQQQEGSIMARLKGWMKRRDEEPPPPPQPHHHHQQQDVTG